MSHGKHQGDTKSLLVKSESHFGSSSFDKVQENPAIRRVLASIARLQVAMASGTSVRDHHDH
jgi:hypothetical protein